jgi:hypothetical protein
MVFQSVAGASSSASMDGVSFVRAAGVFETRLVNITVAVETNAF